MNIPVNKNIPIEEILIEICKNLDISNTQHEDAVKKYKAVASYLEADPNIFNLSPEIYPQGSFNLGTVIKPNAEKDEFDIDLVCELKNASNHIYTQKNIKNLIGNRLKEGRYKEKLKNPEGKRCWTIEYAESTNFHLDILPSIPDNASKTYLRNIDNKFGDSAIAITDNTSEDYSRISFKWPKSNPKGYLKWFQAQMLVQLNLKKEIFAKSINAKVEDVPDYKIKTPLQRAIQLLKRHRDVMYGNHDDKPISIIITTLSAKSYSNENNLYDALINILDGMPRFIERRNGFDWWIANPVDNRENFADKWNLPNSKKSEEFGKWIIKAKRDFSELKNVNLFERKEKLSKSLGQGFTNKAFNNVKSNNFDLVKQSIPSIYSLDYNPDEEYIEEQHLCSLDYNLYLDCRVTQDGFQPFLLSSKNYTIFNTKSLVFFIKYTNVPKPYSIKWKVRNIGEIAKRKNCLRGDIVNGTDTKTETSSFNGDHFVECFIIKDDICVARKAIDVKIKI